MSAAVESGSSAAREARGLDELRKLLTDYLASGPSAARKARRPRRFTVDEFYQLAQAGFFGSDHKRLELVGGEILEPMPIGPAHAAAVRRINLLFTQRVGAAYLVNCQNPIRLGEFSEPQPDLTVLRYRADFYRDAHPRPEDVVLLIEVADSTLDFDLGDKARVYAGAGISEYWVLDLTGGRVRVFRRPDQGEFTETRIAGPDQSLEPGEMPGFSVTVQELLG
jgi:Uma2 family endonuclease